MLPLPHPPRTVDSEFDLLSAEPCTINRIIAICVREWSYFGGMTSHGKHKDKLGHTETQNGYYQKVGEYWKQGTGTNLNGKDTDSAWSATFISYVMKQAGVPARLFPPAIAHAKYVHFAIQNRLTGKPGAAFVGRRHTEYRPKEGDLIAVPRANSGITYDKAAKLDAYKSHSDIVVYVRPGELGMIGGNVADSVTLTKIPLTSGGYLPKSMKVIAILENRLPIETWHEDDTEDRPKKKKRRLRIRLPFLDRLRDLFEKRDRRPAGFQFPVCR